MLVYPLQIVRLALRYGPRASLGWNRALFMVVARFAEASGILQFYGNRLISRKRELIEYK